jgi:hypothetical protein
VELLIEEVDCEKLSRVGRRSRGALETVEEQLGEVVVVWSTLLTVLVVCCGLYSRAKAIR